MKLMRFSVKFLHDKRRFQIPLLCVGILFVCLGVWREEVMTVMQKAIYICLECVGIG